MIFILLILPFRSAGQRCIVFGSNVESFLPTHNTNTMEETFTKCVKRKCSKASGHRGKCDTKYLVQNEFWKKSPVIIGHELKALDAKREAGGK